MGVITAIVSHSHHPHILHISQHILLHQHKIYHALYFYYFLIPCHSCVLMQTSVLKICVTHTQSPFYAKLHHSFTPLSFSPRTPKTPVMPALVLSPIHPFRSPRMHNLYNLYQFPPLSRVQSMSFQNLSLSSPSPSLGP